MRSEVQSDTNHDAQADRGDPQRGRCVEIHRNDRDVPREIAPENQLGEREASEIPNHDLERESP